MKIGESEGRGPLPDGAAEIARSYAKMLSGIRKQFWEKTGIDLLDIVDNPPVTPKERTIRASIAASLFTEAHLIMARTGVATPDHFADVYAMICEMGSTINLAMVVVAQNEAVQRAAEKRGQRN